MIMIGFCSGASLCSGRSIYYGSDARSGGTLTTRQQKQPSQTLGGHNAKRASMATYSERALRASRVDAYRLSALLEATRYVNLRDEQNGGRDVCDNGSVEEPACKQLSLEAEGAQYVLRTPARFSGADDVDKSSEAQQEHHPWP